MAADRRRRQLAIEEGTRLIRLYQDLVCKTSPSCHRRILSCTYANSRPVTPRPARCRDLLPEYWQLPRHIYRQTTLAENPGGFSRGRLSTRYTPPQSFYDAWPERFPFALSAFLRERRSTAYFLTNASRGPRIAAPHEKHNDGSNLQTRSEDRLPAGERTKALCEFPLIFVSTIGLFSSVLS